MKFQIIYRSRGEYLLSKMTNANNAKSIKNVALLSEYEELITTSTCVVKFTADWCNPCKRIAPAYKILAATYSNINFLEVDIDTALEITNFENVQSIPLFLFYSNGVQQKELKVSGGKEELLTKNVETLVKSLEVTPITTVSIDSSDIEEFTIKLVETTLDSQLDKKLPKVVRLDAQMIEISSESSDSEYSDNDSNVSTGSEFGEAENNEYGY